MASLIPTSARAPPASDTSTAWALPALDIASAAPSTPSTPSESDLVRDRIQATNARSATHQASAAPSSVLRERTLQRLAAVRAARAAAEAERVAAAAERAAAMEEAELLAELDTYDDVGEGLEFGFLDSATKVPACTDPPVTESTRRVTYGIDISAGSDAPFVSTMSAPAPGAGIVQEAPGIVHQARAASPAVANDEGDNGVFVFPRGREPRPLSRVSPTSPAPSAQTTRPSPSDAVRTLLGMPPAQGGLAQSVVLAPEPDADRYRRDKFEVLTDSKFHTDLGLTGTK